MEHHVTAEKLEELKAELNVLKTTKRMDVADRLKRAKELGDLSENSEYFEAREEQQWVETRISEIEDIIKNADADAHVIGYAMAEALEKRMTFRRVMKQTVEKVMAVRGVEGVRIVMSGRLGGAEIARTEELKKGSIPLQTFRADVDFARERATLPYGVIGIKVWIYRGEIFNDKKAAPAAK
jgi:small subunit ribosomal protein S3